MDKESLQIKLLEAKQYHQEQMIKDLNRTIYNLNMPQINSSTNIVKI